MGDGRIEISRPGTHRRWDWRHHAVLSNHLLKGATHIFVLPDAIRQALLRLVDKFLLRDQLARDGGEVLTREHPLRREA
jgi:hypothetical protein